MYCYRDCGAHMQGCPMMYSNVNPTYYQPNENVQLPNANVQQQDTMMEEKQLEMYYPEIYFKIYPVIKMHCDNIEHKHGKHHCPPKEDIDNAIENISIKIEKELDDDDKKECDKDWEKKKRQYPRGRLVRDLVGIMFLNELIGRRRPPYYPYYGGYGYNYWY